MLQLGPWIVSDRDPCLTKCQELLYHEMSLIFLLVLLLWRVKVHEPLKMQTFEAVEVPQARRDLAELVPNNGQILQTFTCANIVWKSPNLVFADI